LPKTIFQFLAIYAMSQFDWPAVGSPVVLYFDSIAAHPDAIPDGSLGQQLQESLVVSGEW
jgi:hypothetical protein